MLGRNKVEYKIYRQERDYLQAQITALQTAFDAFFDVVAADLGYEAAKGYTQYLYGLCNLSPRQLAKTAPQPEIIRHKTARCKRAQKAPSAKEK